MLDQIIQDIQKQGWSHAKGVLTKEQLIHIQSFFEDHLDEFVQAKVGQGVEKAYVPTIRGDFTFWLEPLQPNVIFSSVFAMLNSLRLAINENFFMNLKQYECHLAYYPVGTFYKKHSDCFEKESSRALSFIFYVHEEWEKENGGELVIYNKKGEVLGEITPEPGSFVCFLSAEFPHEVKTATKERRSLTGWMHTKLIY